MTPSTYPSAEFNSQTVQWHGGVDDPTYPTQPQLQQPQFAHTGRPQGPDFAIPQMQDPSYTPGIDAAQHSVAEFAAPLEHGTSEMYHIVGHGIQSMRENVAGPVGYHEHAPQMHSRERFRLSESVLAFTARLLQRLGGGR